MADIRIKDLTTPASSTASDDFIAVDGTTNGTRKLNAFSPTFGGNATVTGTLTGNSTATIAGRVISNASSTASDSVGFAHVTGYSSGGKTYTGFSAGGIAVNQNVTFGYVYDSGTPANSFAHITPYGSTEGSLFKFSPAGVLTLGATTASTTTSSGALVVGNGTSGGLGVGGDVNIGGSLTVTGASNGIICNGAGLSLNTAGSASVRFQDAGVSKWWIYKLSGDPWLYFRDMVNGRMQLQMVPGATSGTATSTFNSNLEVTSTTASNNTSSGALVVSGGVGVAGAIYAGGLLSSSATTSLDGLPTAGIFGGTKRVALGYNTSGDYGFVACADSGTTWKELHLNPLGGLVKVPQSTASNDAYTGAFVVGGGVGAAGAVNAGTFFGLVDGVTAPATGSGYARIYVDSADGDLKVKFGDGTVKTIATDS